MQSITLRQSAGGGMTSPMGGLFYKDVNGSATTAGWNGGYIGDVITGIDFSKIVSVIPSNSDGNVPISFSFPGADQVIRVYAPRSLSTFTLRVFYRN